MKNKKNDPVNIVYKISELIRKLTDEDFSELEDIVTNQKEYYNPLKMGTVNRQRELANHNEKMVKCLKELKDLVGE